MRGGATGALPGGFDGWHTHQDYFHRAGRNIARHLDDKSAIVRDLSFEFRRIHRLLSF